MEESFGRILSALRQSRNLSQRKLASALYVSQALLSHYENGSREPGLSFVCRACDYFGVSADFLLGRVSASEDSAPVALPALSALEPLLAQPGQEELREPALGYLNAAAKKLHCRLSAPGEPVAAAEQEAEMLRNELAVLKLLADRAGEPEPL